MNPIDFQQWAKTAHANYEYHREVAGLHPGNVIGSYFRSHAIHCAQARAADFKHCWRMRFGTSEPEAWA